MKARFRGRPCVAPRCADTTVSCPLVPSLFRSSVSRLLVLGLADGNFTGALEHLDVVVLHEVQKACQSKFTAGDLNGECLTGGIQHLGAKNVAEFQNILLLVAEEHAHQHNFSIDSRLVAVVRDLDDIDEFVELFDDLVQLGTMFIHINGHAGKSRIFAGSYVERVDVEPASGEESRHSG